MSEGRVLGWILAIGIGCALLAAWFTGDPALRERDTARRELAECRDSLATERADLIACYQGKAWPTRPMVIPLPDAAYLYVEPQIRRAFPRIGGHLGPPADSGSFMVSGYYVTFGRDGVLRVMR